MKNINDKSLEQVAKKANIDVNQLKQATQNGTVDDFIDKNMSKQASEKLKSILSDKSATEKLLSTPQAKELLNKLLDK
jgi:hypothetical protein